MLDLCSSRLARSSRGDSFTSLLSYPREERAGLTLSAVSTLQTIRVNRSKAILRRLLVVTQGPS